MGIDRGNASGTGSAEGLAVGSEEGDGVLAGGELSITKQGMADLKDALSEVKALYPYQGRLRRLSRHPRRRINS